MQNNKLKEKNYVIFHDGSKVKETVYEKIHNIIEKNVFCFSLETAIKIEDIYGHKEWIKLSKSQRKLVFNTLIYMIENYFTDLVHVDTGSKYFNYYKRGLIDC